jgi:hypothetical protein
MLVFKQLFTFINAHCSIKTNKIELFICANFCFKLARFAKQKNVYLTQSSGRLRVYKCSPPRQAFCPKGHLKILQKFINFKFLILPNICIEKFGQEYYLI